MMTGTLVTAFLAAAVWLLLRPPGRSIVHGAQVIAGSGVRRASAAEGGGAGGADGTGSPGPAGIADPALMLDLVAAMLDAGQSLLPALGILADVVDPETALCLRRVQAALELGAPWAVAWELADPRASGSPPSVHGRANPQLPGALRRDPQASALQRPGAPAAQLRESLTFVAATGAPSAAVLLAAAAQLRRRRSRESERRAAALGVKLVVPMGLCALPAFIVLTVVPLLLSLLPSFP